MYLFYVDESGTPDPIVNVTNGCSSKFVIGGILIESNCIHLLEEEFYQLKEKFLKDPLKEMKYNVDGINIKLGYNKQKLREETYDFIQNFSCDFKILTAVVDKTRLCEKGYIEQNKAEIYSIAFQFLLERLNFELNSLNESCLVVLDSRNRNDNKTLYCSYMKLLMHGTNFQSSEKFHNLLPSIAFSDSEFCLNLCVADFCCAAVFQLEEYNRPLYYQTIKNKFRNKNGKVEGFGIVKFP